MRVLGLYHCKWQSVAALVDKGRFEWHKCLGKRKKQTNYLVKFSSDSRDALDSHIMNIGFPVVLSAHFLASFFYPICGSRGTHGFPTAVHGDQGTFFNIKNFISF